MLYISAERPEARLTRGELLQERFVSRWVGDLHRAPAVVITLLSAPCLTVQGRYLRPLSAWSRPEILTNIT